MEITRKLNKESQLYSYTIYTKVSWSMLIMNNSTLMSMLPPCLTLIVVATTHWNGTCSMLTSAKLSVGYLVVGITRELDKEPSLHYSSIYINTMWFILQQYLPALMSIHHPHVLLLTVYIYSDVILLISVIYMCTICTPWGTVVPWHHS